MRYALKFEGGEHFVFESETEIYFGPFKNKEEARKHMRFLNKGGAFDGRTPSFMMNGDFK